MVARKSCDRSVPKSERNEFIIITIRAEYRFLVAPVFGLGWLRNYRLFHFIYGKFWRGVKRKYFDFLFLSLSAHFWHEAINKYDWCVRLMHGREKCGESLKCIEQTAGRWKKLLIQNSVFDKEYLLLERFFYLFISWINNRFEWNVIDQRTLLRLLIYIVVFGSFRLIRNQWYGGNDGPNTVTSHSQ